MRGPCFRGGGECINNHRLWDRFRGLPQAVDMDRFGHLGGKLYPYPPTAGAPGRRFPGGGSG
eukprot:4936202-Pyramimonas_sp.AAC.1